MQTHQLPTRTVRTVVKLHQAQRDFRLSTAIYRGFVGGRGSGKSWAGAYDLIRRAKPGRLYMIASPSYTVLSDTTIPTIKKVLADKNVFVETYWAGSGDDEGKIKDETKATVRCIPFNQNAPEGKCVYTGKPTTQKAIFARAY